jgi:hypothetical protein
MQHLVKKESDNGDTVYEAEIIPENEAGETAPGVPVAETSTGLTRKIVRAAGILLAGFESVVKVIHVLADGRSRSKSQPKGGGQRTRKSRHRRGSK